MLRRRRTVAADTPSTRTPVEPKHGAVTADTPHSRPRKAEPPAIELPLRLAVVPLSLALAIAWPLLALYATCEPHPHTLATLLLATTRALSAANATHFLTPGAGLSPAALGSARLPPHLPGLSVSTLSSEAPRVLLVAAHLSATPHVSFVETHAGLRVYAGRTESPWDYAAPYVDLVALRAVRGARAEYLVSGCCDCGPMTVGACAKSLCACMVCAYGVDEVLPLRRLWVWGVGWLFVPNSVDDVLLSDLERHRIIDEMGDNLLGVSDPSED